MAYKDELFDLWSETFMNLKQSCSEHEKDMWLSLIAYHSGDDNRIILNLPSQFHIDQIIKRYGNQIEEILLSLAGKPILVEYRTAKGETPPVSKKPEKDEKNQNIQNMPTDFPSSLNIKNKEKHPQLREDYNFDDFVVGENNSFAANAALAISKNPGTNYNPFLIYGGVGLGKTHLMQAIGNSIYQNFENTSVIYAPTETFINEFTYAIRTKTTQQFKNKYRNVDVLLLDDIHYLEDKTGTQEELFHTFNALYDANKQMVFTCDRPVTELKNIVPRLKSRFARGLNVDLQPPNFETRLAILNQKLDQKNAHIPLDVVEFIAQNITTNIRDMEAALLKVTAYAELVGKDVTVEIAQQQLKQIISIPLPGRLTISLIQKVVAGYFNFTPNDLKGRKRTKAISFPRQISMYIIRELTDYSTTEIGLEFGGRDHTTVMHSVQKIEDQLKTDSTLEPIIQKLINEIQEQAHE